MSQTIHILKKDLRRFSWEIVLSLLLLALYGWCQPVLWQPFDMLTFNATTITALRYMGAEYFGLLVGLGWMVLVVRLIYEESLTDDRQFWVTRPYRWHNLLAAKILFVITVINLPLLLAELCLLASAGFSPFQHISRPAYLHGTLCVFLLPLATLAVVTGGRRQMTRAIIVVLIFLVVCFRLSVSAVWLSTPALQKTSVWEMLGWAVMLVVPIVVIVRQYALRKTAQARWILVGAGLVLTVVAAAQPKQQFPVSEYAPVTESAEGYFDMTLPPPDNASKRYVQAQGQNTFVYLWFRGGEVAEGLVARAEAIQVTMVAPDGSRWASDWQQQASAVLNHTDSGTTDASGQQSRSLGTFLNVDRNFFDKFKDVPINLQVVTAATLYRDHRSAAFVPHGREFKIPDVGTCVVSELSGRVNMTCRAPLSNVPFVGVSVRLFRDCHAEDDATVPVYQSYAWWPSSEQWGAAFGFNPVSIFSISAENEVGGKALTVCPSSTFTMHQPEKIRRIRVQKDFTGVKLSELLPQ